jgi:hypothetical protein
MFDGVHRAWGRREDAVGSSRNARSSDIMGNDIDLLMILCLYFRGNEGAWGGLRAAVTAMAQVVKHDACKVGMSDTKMDRKTTDLDEKTTLTNLLQGNRLDITNTPYDMVEITGGRRSWQIFAAGKQDDTNLYAFPHNRNPMFSDNSRSKYAPDIDAMIKVNVWSKPLMRRHGLELIMRIIAECDQYCECYGGFVNIDASEVLQGGLLYWRVRVLNIMTWQERVQYMDWLLYGQGEGNRQRVHSLSWAYYLPLGLAAKLGDVDEFLKRFVAARGTVRGADPLLPIGEKLPGGGLFLAVSRDPLQLSDPEFLEVEQPCILHSVWLWNEFRRAGLI